MSWPLLIYSSCSAGVGVVRVLTLMIKCLNSFSVLQGPHNFPFPYSCISSSTVFPHSARTSLGFLKHGGHPPSPAPLEGLWALSSVLHLFQDLVQMLISQWDLQVSPSGKLLIYGVKLHIIKLRASLSYLEYNGLNKPQIIVIKVLETSKYNEYQQIVPSERTVTALHSKRPAKDAQNSEENCLQMKHHLKMLGCRTWNHRWSTWFSFVISGSNESSSFLKRELTPNIYQVLSKFHALLRALETLLLDFYSSPSLSDVCIIISTMQMKKLRHKARGKTAVSGPVMSHRWSCDVNVHMLSSLGFFYPYSTLPPSPNGLAGPVPNRADCHHAVTLPTI
jgi:hypothetical protein